MADERMFGPAEIEALTDGAVSQTDLRNWVRDARFNTPLAEPKAGKPRDYPIAAAYEAALLSAFSRFSVPLAAAQRWNKDLLSLIASGETVPMLVIEPGNKQFVAFSDTSIPIRDFLGAFEGSDETGSLVESSDDLGGDLPNERKPLALAIVNLPEIIRRVDEMRAKG